MIAVFEVNFIGNYETNEQQGKVVVVSALVIEFILKPPRRTGLQPVAATHGSGSPHVLRRAMWGADPNPNGLSKPFSHAPSLGRSGAVPVASCRRHSGGDVEAELTGPHHVPPDTAKA